MCAGGRDLSVVGHDPLWRMQNTCAIKSRIAVENTASFFRDYNIVCRLVTNSCRSFQKRLFNDPLPWTKMMSPVRHYFTSLRIIALRETQSNATHQTITIGTDFNSHAKPRQMLRTREITDVRGNAHARS